MPYTGSMCYMSGSIQMENVYLHENDGGMWQWLFGKSMTSVVLYNSGQNDGFVGIAAPSSVVRKHANIV
ncbi:Tryptophan rna-binding attenuator protein-like protein [Thalictrum thalictroides]|uniref:Tryptophan rna-binding attenuator protein-like protein n=1 Tax=Thalictrum thalictroides TaxID=46969 RepID=A0A7J6V033_THATH|nr:Tryptophan rna-binding attenuator protein-like protein [Thalictrum thalictroides]